MFKHIAMAAGLATLLAGTSATGATVTFSVLEPLVPNPTQIAFAETDPFTENGITFNPLVGHYDVFPVFSGAMLNIDSWNTAFTDFNTPMTLEITADFGAFNLDSINFVRIDTQGNLIDTPVFRLEADLVGGGTETGYITDNFTPQNGGDLFFPNVFNGIEALRFVQEGQGIVYLYGMEFSPFSNTAPGTGGGTGQGSGNGGAGGGTGNGGQNPPNLTPVPLPAAGWLLLGSLGALLQLKRRTGSA